MKYTVKVADSTYEVEIEDIRAQPVIAHVGDERFEVHPEEPPKPQVASLAKDAYVKELPKPSASPGVDFNQLIAPLPGTVVEIFAKNGEHVEAGNVVLIIEAMKMKNSIRSTRSGKVAEVLATVGQTVAHKQALMRFE